MIGAGIPSRSCRCASCRARDAREFERIATAYVPLPRSRQAVSFLWPETESLQARVCAYTYGRRTNG